MAPLSAKATPHNSVVELCLTTNLQVFPRTPDGGGCITASPTTSTNLTTATSSSSSSSSTTGSVARTPPVLSYGAIAGIVVGVVIGVVLTMLGFYVFLTRTDWGDQRLATRLREREKRFLRPRRRKTSKTRTKTKTKKNEGNNTRPATAPASARQARRDLRAGRDARGNGGRGQRTPAQRPSGRSGKKGSGR